MHLQITKKIIHTQTNMTPLTTSIQLCISPDDNDHSKNPENYAKIEEKLSRVLAQLDGHLDGPDFREYTKDFGSSEETYKELTKSLKRTMGLYIPKCEKMTIDPKVKNLPQATVDKMRRAIHVLNN